LSFDCRAIVELDARRQLQWDLKKARCERRFRFCSVGTEGALLTEKQSTEVKGALIKVAVWIANYAWKTRTKQSLVLLNLT
jgi:hypothetical protein